MTSTANAREQAAVHHAWRLLLMRGLHAAGGAVFAAVVPRWMGPEGYGQVALLVSLSLWFTIAADFGFTEVLVREVPRCEREQDARALPNLFGSLLSLRTAAGVVTAALYFVTTTLWLRELDRVALFLLALAVAVRAPATLCFSLHLGKNRADRWGLEDILRLWGNMLLMLPGYLFAGLRGAALGVLVLEGFIAAVGIISVRAHVEWKTLRPRFEGMGAMLRFGLFFYGVHLTSAAFGSSGEVLLRAFHGDYANIAFFRVAYSAYSIAASAMIWTTFAFAPLLTALHLDGDTAAMRLWLERVSKWLGVACVIMFLGVVFVGPELVPLLFGAAFRPAVPSLTLLTAGLFPVALTITANLAALGYGQGRSILGASLVQIVVFWLLGPLFVRKFGGPGAALGIACGLVAQALFATLTNQGRAGYALRPWFGVVLLGAALLPLSFLRRSAPVNAGLLCVSLVGYAALLRLFRLTTTEELSALKSALRGGARPNGAAADASAREAERPACS